MERRGTVVPIEHGLEKRVKSAIEGENGVKWATDIMDCTVAEDVDHSREVPDVHAVKTFHGDALMGDHFGALESIRAFPAWFYRITTPKPCVVPRILPRDLVVLLVVLVQFCVLARQAGWDSFSALSSP
jgi:hypothetical protein